MKRKFFWPVLCFLAAMATAGSRVCYGRPQEIAAYGIWEGVAKGGLHVQSTFHLRPQLEIATSMWVSAGPKCLHGGVLAGPRWVLDLVSWVPALSLLAGITGGRDLQAGFVGQFELLRFLTPHTGLSAKAGGLWLPGHGIAPQVGFGYFWRA